MEARVKQVWVAGEAIISPLGNTIGNNFSALQNASSGLCSISDERLSPRPVMAGRIKNLESEGELTRFENMCVQCLRQLLSGGNVNPETTLFILSTTKGNIDLLSSDPDHPRLSLHAAAKHIAQHCGLKNGMVISNACVSGVMALTVARRYLQAGRYENAIVLGADELSAFIISGFESLGALSPQRCRPFDRDRNGINLGEGAAAMLLTTAPEKFPARPKVKIMGAGLSNDANHISGPSRTGEELAFAIRSALNESMVAPDEIDFLSAHGTATLYNDEMEAKAFDIAGVSDIPIHSLKGYYGHTLGAAGVIETVMSIQSLLDGMLIASLGFDHLGVSKNVNVIRKVQHKSARTFLKTASGFGGCNAAIVFQKQL